MTQRNAKREVETELSRRRFLQIVNVGVDRKLTVADLAKILPSEESALLGRILGSVPTMEVLAWLEGPGSEHLNRALMPANGNPKRRKKAVQVRLPGIEAEHHPRTETIEFDAQVIQTILKMPGSKAGPLRDELHCSRGKLRLSLERAKKRGHIRQKGDLNAATYRVTADGKKAAKGKK